MSKITTQKKKVRNAEHLRKMRELHGPNWGKVVCESCHKHCDPEEIVVGPDPFASEIGKDNRIVRQCKKCDYDSCMSI